MADTKISALSAATLPLGTADLVPVVQGGASERASVADIRGLNTDYVDTQPATPTTGGALFTRNRARRLPAFVGPQGLDTVLQPAIFSNRVAQLKVINNTATQVTDGLAVTNIAVPTLVAVASTNFFTSMVRHRYSSAATVNAYGGFRSTTAQWFTSATANMGGMFMVCRVGLNATTVTNRLFIGFSLTTGALSATVDPSTLFNLFGFGSDSGDANLQFMHNDGSGACTKIDLGANFPSRTAATYFYEFRIFVPSGAGNSLRWSATRLNDGIVANGGTTVAADPTPITTNMPAVGSVLSFHANHGNGGTATAVSMDFQSLYIETDN